MKTWWVTAAWVLSLVAAAQAQSTDQVSRQLLFHTSPPGAKVEQLLSETKYLGVADAQPLPVMVPAGQQVYLTFRLSLDGYQDRRIEINSNQLKADTLNEYPDHDSIVQLLPGSTYVMLRDQLKAHAVDVSLLVAAVAALMGFLVVPWWKRTKETARLAQKFESLTTGEAHPTDPDVKGQRFGRYVAVDQLGKGGMAKVYRGVPAETMDTGEAVAIKVINPDKLQDPESRARFDREVRIGAKLNHPNIVRLIDWGTEGPFFLIMELVDGYPLRKLVRTEGMSPREALRLLHPVFDAMAYAHDQGVWHRDLKPENIFVGNKDGRITVMDFGISRQASDVTVTATDQMPVTPGYMSPEQFSGRGVAAGSDQYSLGVIVWEMVVGERPFDDESPLVLVLKHVQAPLPDLQALKPQLPEAFTWALSRMLAKDPADRFTDLRQAWSALESGAYR